MYCLLRIMKIDFLGNDGEFTFFVNLVQGYFAKSSLSPEHYEIGDQTIDECFNIIRQFSSNCEERGGYYDVQTT